MLNLVFDTETTGLPKVRKVSREVLNNWPHIVQLSYILYDTDNKKILVESDNIIRLNNSIEIPKESTKIHGITKEISNSKGISIETAIREFIKCLNKANNIVGHNIDFDLNMILVECYRINYDNIFNKILQKSKKTNKPKIFCTMNMSKEICNIYVKNKYTGETFLKSPKLIELHEKLFLKRPNNLHNSFNDIIITLRCFHLLAYNEDLCNSDKKFNSMVKSLL